MKCEAMRKLIGGMILLLCALQAQFTYASDTKNAANHVTVDAHVHLFDFFQKTAGLPQLLAAMDKNKIQTTVIFGMPMAIKQTQPNRIWPAHYFMHKYEIYFYLLTDIMVHEHIQKLTAAQQTRFYPLISGFNPNDPHAVEHIKKLVKLFPNFWHGIGEIFFQHDALIVSHDAYNTPIPHPNTPNMQRVYQYAARCGVPVLIHENITTATISPHTGAASPATTTVTVSKATNLTNLPEFEDTLRRNPHTTFIWAHAGTSPNIAVNNLPSVLRRLLIQHRNLYLDLSWVVYEQEILDATEQPKTAWIKLIEEFPERFTIGSDSVGQFTHYDQDIGKYDKLLGKLKPSSAKKVGGDNARRLFAHTMSPAAT